MIEYDQLMERGLVTGTITCPDGSKVEVSEKSIVYHISQPGTYTFTAVTSEGKSSKIDVKVEKEYTLTREVNSVYLLDSFEGRIHITNENKPRIRYTKNDTEQEEDLTTCIRENVEISLKKIVSLFEPSSENIEITVEVDGKQIKWKGSIILDLE